MTLIEALLRAHLRPASLPIEPADCYAPSRAALARIPKADQVATALERQAATHPCAVPPFPGTIVRLLRTHRYADFPALRLFYSVDEAAVRFLWIEEWDEMEG